MLENMTVKELVEIAKRMELPYSGKRKAELAAFLTERINGWHTIALDMNAAKSVETFEVGEVTLTGLSAKLMTNHMEMIRRYNPTLKRDKYGFIILTPAQRRRIHKKDRSFGKKIGFYKEAASV